MTRQAGRTPGAMHEEPHDHDRGLAFDLSIFPACYAGRWPHIHFEVYSSVDGAMGGDPPIATSQLAFPADVCETVYATDGYSQSVTNLAQVSLESDNVFADGYELELATMSGGVEDGIVAELTVTV